MWFSRARDQNVDHQDERSVMVDSETKGFCPEQKVSIVHAVLSPRIGRLPREYCRYLCLSVHQKVTCRGGGGHHGWIMVSNSELEFATVTCTSPSPECESP